MTKEEFKAKVKGVVDSQTFCKLGKLFEYDDYDDMKIAYIPGDLMSSEADMPLDEFMDDLYEQIVEPLVTPAQGWIPVSERFPEEDGGYLVTVNQRYITTALWFGLPKYWDNVIAWMPLPEPYKKEVEE